MTELLIQHNDKVYLPMVESKFTWTTERQGTPGQLQFKVLLDDTSQVSEGDAVRLQVDGKKVFYGFIFKLKYDKNKIVNVTAYDQIRYLKNKDTYVYQNKTASELIRMIASDYQMNIGDVDDTEYKIASRVEENTTLMDIIQNALDTTLLNINKLFVLFDDSGRLTLKNLKNMIVNVLIDEETGENYDYSSSIDDNTYNRIKLTYDNDKTGTREVYIAQDGNNINNWGVLQHFDTLQEGENGQAKADALLSLYNKKTRNLTIKNAFGDIRVRAGSMVVVMLDLGDAKIQNLMLVEKCKHEFDDNQHFMTLTLRGGDFIV